MMVDILCGILAGSLSSKDILPMYTSSIKEKRYISHFFMAINIKHFIKVNVFKKQLQDIVDRLRDLPTSSQDNSVMVPGDPEKKCYDIRIKEGIPIDEIKYEEFLAISSMFKEVIE